MTPAVEGPDAEGSRPPVSRSVHRAVNVNDLPREGAVTIDLPVPTRVLAVGAHPDDIELGCGGTLAKWIAAGAEIHLLVLTDGGKGSWDPERDLASLVAARQNEQREAARRLGTLDVGFLGSPDGELRNGVREQWEVSRWIRSVRPDVVLGHDPWRRYRLHPDHRNAGFILTDSIVAARDPLFFRDQGTSRPRSTRSSRTRVSTRRPCGSQRSTMTATPRTTPRGRGHGRPSSRCRSTNNWQLTAALGGSRSGSLSIASTTSERLVDRKLLPTS
jgi:LmbE family N-acetylglucosaminyl deacetylase